MAAPGMQRFVGLADVLLHGREVKALRIEDAFSGFAPRSWKAGIQYQLQARRVFRVFYAEIVDKLLLDLSHIWPNWLAR